MAHALLAIDLILDLLAQTPAAIQDTTRGLREDDLSRRPEPDEWSIVEVLAHLRASADVRGDQRIQRMLADDEPTMRTVSPRRWPATPRYAAQRFDESLMAYAEQRARLLRRLESLSPEEWERGAMLTGLRMRRHETVHSEADALTRHEVRHLTQIKRGVALLRPTPRKGQASGPPNSAATGPSMLRL
jgi:hypothetical protein